MIDYALLYKLETKAHRPPPDTLLDRAMRYARDLRKFQGTKEHMAEWAEENKIPQETAFLAWEAAL